jgi:hexokinase
VACPHFYHNTSLSSDYLADSVDAFLTSSTESYNPNPIDADQSAIPLGLTFSFPVEQTALDKGILLTWTKGFTAKNAINKDVVKLLQDAFDRKHLHVKCVALVNDVCPLVSSSSYERY